MKLLLESGVALDYRPDTGEEFPRTTLCDEPLRLAIRNKHFVSWILYKFPFWERAILGKINYEKGTL